jgi:uncharacterized protein (TIGR03083 family)
VHCFWRTIVRDRMTSPDGYAEPSRPPDNQPLEFYRAGLTDTVRVLRDADPTERVWTWSSDQTAGFVMRRMAHETAVHRWDADRAANRDAPIEAELASDGVDEFLEHHVDDPAEGDPLIGHSVHIHCTDVAGEWTVRSKQASGLDVTREHAKCDCAIRGAASDLLLVLWRRKPLSVADVVGDGDIAAHFVALTGLD